MSVSHTWDVPGPRYPVAILPDEWDGPAEVADLPADPLARAAMEDRVDEWWEHLPLHSKMGCHYYAMLMAEQRNDGPLPVLYPTS